MILGAADSPLVVDGVVAVTVTPPVDMPVLVISRELSFGAAITSAPSVAAAPAPISANNFCLTPTTRHSPFLPYIT